MKVLLIRFGKIGDLLLLLPPLRTLRANYPELSLILLTDSHYRGAAQLFDCVDEIRDIATTTYSGGNISASMQYAIKYGYGSDVDIVLDLQAEQESWGLVSQFDKSRRYGFATMNTNIDAYTDTMEPQDLCIVTCYYRLLQRAFPRLPPKFLNATRLPKFQSPLLLGYAPGGSAPCKRWSLIKWKELSHELKRRYSHAEAVLYTVDANFDCEGWAIDRWVWGTPLIEVARHLSAMDICVANESGIMHLATVLGCPTIGLFCFGNPVVWGSYSDLLFPVFHRNDCQKPERANCEQMCSQPDCLEKLQVEEVANAVSRLIDQQ